MEANSSKEDLQKHLVQFLSEGCFKKISSMDFFFFFKHGFFFKKSRVSVYLLMMNQQSCMAAKWVFQCTASFFLLSPRRVSEMEKNKALNFSEAKSGKMCVIH